MIAKQYFDEIEETLLERKRAIDGELAEIALHVDGSITRHGCQKNCASDCGVTRDSRLESGELAQYIYVSRDADGKRKRKQVDADAPEVRGFLRGLYLRKELALVEKNVRTIQRARSSYFDYTPDDVLKLVPERFQGMPETHFLLGLKGSTHGGLGGLADGALAGHSDATSGGGLSELEAWARAPYQKSDYMPEGREHTTSRGLKVRSKSEAAICEALYKFEVPFRYEEELVVGRHKYAPDFVVRSRKTGKLFYWEHCGLTSSKDYMDRHYRKMQDYEEFGIVPWDNLIVTYDGEGGTLNLAWIEAIIKCHLV